MDAYLLRRRNARSPGRDYPTMSEPRVPKTDEELRRLAFDVVSGMVFTDRHVEEPRDVSMVFMPLVLMKPDDLKAFQSMKPRLIYEYLSEAGPRTCNGMPGFFSMRYLDEEECKRFWPIYEDMHTTIETKIKGKLP